MKIQIIFIILTLSFQGALAAAEPILQNLLGKIHKAPLVQFDVEKKTKSELLGKETTSPGTIYVSPGKFRWDTQGSENSQIIYDGKTIWTVQEPPKGFKAPPQITRMKLDKKSEGQIFLNSLFHKNFDKEFEVKSKEKVKNLWKFTLIPIHKSLGVEELVLKVDDNSELKEISYVDEIQNKIVIEINKTILSKKGNTNLFRYQPPKGAQVNNL